MKRILLVVSAFVIIGMISCKKETTCECVTSTNTEGVEDVISTVTIEGREKCSDLNSTVTTMGITTTTTCKEK